MSNEEPLDRAYLLSHARELFPSTEIEVIHMPGEIIYLFVNGRQFIFEIGSDDADYVFTDGKMTFSIPLMDTE